jgi:phospholipid transport system transporter-binding protein
MKLATASMTNDNAAALLESGVAAIRGGDAHFDLSAVTQVDSAAVALLLAWKREAQARNAELKVINVPPALVNLANLYGVDTLLGCSKAVAGERADDRPSPHLSP